MASPTVDKVVKGNLVMHDHSEADLGAVLDSRYVNVTGDTMTGPLIIDGSTNAVQLTVQANGTQTANLTEWQNSSGTVLAGVDSRGVVFSHGGIDVNSVYIGIQSGNIAHTNALRNVGIGGYTLKALTTGDDNVAVGTYALARATTGYANVAVGYYALYSLTIGYENTAIGLNTMDELTEGIRNFGMGRGTARKLTTGDNNLCIGYQALYYNVTGDNNVALGSQAGQGASGQSCGNNTFIGTSSGFSISTGSSNIFIGYNSGYRQTTNGNLLIVDNQQRADVATELSNAILYGVMAAAPANQTLNINANVEITQDTFWTGDGSGLPYGSVYGNDIAWSQATAVQNTWYEIADADMADGQLNLVTHDGNGKLTVTKAGRYLINYRATVSCSAAGKEVQTAISVSGTEANDGIDHEIITNASAKEGMGSTAILDLAASATIEISIRTTDTGTPDLTVEHINVTIIQIGGT